MSLEVWNLGLDVPEPFDSTQEKGRVEPPVAE